MTEKRKNKILITGGAGFIGSNLCGYFISKNYQVVCLDNFSTGFRHNIEAFLKEENFTLIEGDITNFSDCQKAVEGVEFVLHQAALGSVPRSLKDPVTTNNVNVGGFVNMLTASKDEGVKRFIYAASSSTYGDSKDSIKVEESIGKPLSPYAVTKYVNEVYADVFSRLYNIEVIGLRYFNVFGRRQDPNGAYAAVIPKFFSKLLSGESPVVNGDGSYSRDFTYIDNVIQMNELAILASNQEALNTVYNVAYGQRTTLNELIANIKEALEIYDDKVNDIPITYGSKREGDIPHSLADIEKAKKLLGYQPLFSLKEGLKEAAQWYWENFKSNH